MTKTEWLNRAVDEYVRLGLPQESAEIEAADDWDVLSAYDSDPEAALARDPIDMARAGAESADDDGMPRG